MTFTCTCVLNFLTVGGVLYSIEIVSVFFSVRSYWHGFFAAAVGALFWRLLTVWFQYEENITHIFKTSFRLENPYETLEIISFALLGIISGLSAFALVSFNKCIVQLIRRPNRFNAFMKRFPLSFPIIVSTFLALIMFPDLFGKYYASWMNSGKVFFAINFSWINDLPTEQSMHELFDNRTWHSMDHSVHDEIVDNWRTDHTSVFTHTLLFFVMNMIIVGIGCTIPIPSGLIVPSFKIGAGLGRLEV